VLAVAEREQQRISKMRVFITLLIISAFLDISFAEDISNSEKMSTFDLPTSVSNRNFKIQLDKTVEALAEIQAIYGDQPNKSLQGFEIDEIQNILRSTQSTALNIYNNKLLYGQDDRKNIYDASTHELSAAKSVALVVNSSDILNSTTSGVYNLPGSTTGLCPTEQFYDEPAPGFCSAFRVGEDLIATAGHCITNQAQCTRTSFVFNFAMETPGDRPHKAISASDVYGCSEIVDGELNGPDQSDWRVLRVNRLMADDIPIVSVRDEGQIDIGDPITIIGHPMGLPLKITPGGTVRSHGTSYFVANPDTYGGNSGSPAFNGEKLQNGELFVEGILVRGEEDFEQFTPCMISKICALDGCRGEDVTYASEFIAALE